MIQDYKPQIKIKDKIYSPYTKYIKYGRGVLSQIDIACKKVLPSGHIGVLYADDVMQYANIVKKTLLSKGYKVSSVVYAPYTEADETSVSEVEKLAEDVRLIIGIGGGTISEISRYSAFKRDCEYIICMTAPCCDSVYHSISEIKQDNYIKREKCKPPIGVYIDLDTFSTLSKDLLAGGYGNVFSKYFSLFERKVEAYIKAKDVSPSKEEELIFNEFYNTPSTGDDLYMALCQANTKIGLISQCEENYDERRTSEQVVTFFYDKYCDDGYSLGEKLFTSSIFLICMYKVYLAKEYKFPLICTSITDDLMSLAKSCNVKFNKIIKNLGYNKEIIKNEFIINEYREDIKELLQVLVERVKDSLKAFKRIFPDAGYNYGQRHNTTDLFSVIKASSWLCKEGSLLRHIKDLGLI